jgi:ABC-type polysaccharide/polyol phosphate transport system ATPase subunit
MGVKPRGKAKAEGLEILANASLKLKAGVHYALVGRNGSGKSSKWSLVSIVMFDTTIMAGIHHYWVYNLSLR